MAYSVKEIFYTLQGEGAQAGHAAVFCRFAGCNLWSGLEKDRASAVCQFCDTEFVGTDGEGGAKFASARDLALAIAAKWPNGQERRYVVCTGGEPLLQLDEPLIDALHGEGFEVAVETNGTRPAPKGLDWICVSPKAGAEFVLRQGDELKIIFPQMGIDPESFRDLRFKNYFLQPMDGNALQENTRLAIEYCKSHPQWRLSIQSHKMLGIR